MHASANALTPTSGGHGPDTSHVFPWSLGEVRASLALCPPAAFHITGLRLERLGADAWWGDLAGYRDDLGAPFIWPGFRVRRGRAWDVTFPPYLVDLDGAWRALVHGTMQRLVVAALADPASVKGEALFVTVQRPSGVPTPGNAGGARVAPAERSTASWLRHGKRYAFAAQLARSRAVLVLGAGPGARMLARTARRVVAVDLSCQTGEYAARVYRSPRLSFITAESGRLPFTTASFDMIVALEGREADVQALQHEIDRVLHPDGMLVASVENLEALARLTATLGGGFAAAQVWSQRGAQGGPEILDEFELEAGLAGDAEAFVVLARRQAVAAPTDHARLRQGAELLGANRLVEAFRVFAEILRSEPTSVAALVGAAHCALAVDDTRGARELLRRVLAVEPDHAGARAALRELDGATLEVGA